MSIPSHPGPPSRLRGLLVSLTLLTLVGWPLPSGQAACDPLLNPSCIPTTPPPPLPKKDFYCAYPVLTTMAITDAHEGPLNGPEAYMYFHSAGAAKTGSYADFLGTGGTVPSGAPLQTRYDYDNDAWASNFKGTVRVTGKSSRTQWEWLALPGTSPQYSRWGLGGTPYRYGKVCKSVDVGSLRPDLGSRAEDVYEDDECVLGICNPDDYVGGFRIYPRLCEEVWSKGYATGWTGTRPAEVWGDLFSVSYRLWCYACANATSCTTGVGPDRGPGY